MMRKLLLSVGVVAVALSLLISGCVKPQVEMEMAESMIKAAQDAGAGNQDNSGKRLGKAQKLLDNGQKQMKRLDYMAAKVSFEKAHKEAMKAYELAVDKECPKPCCVAIVAPPKTSSKTHVVERGDCLWNIAGEPVYYNDAFQWPLIYDQNRTQIDEAAKASGLPHMREDGWAHWIFPGQNLSVPMDSSIEAIKDARMRAGAPAPYLPPGK